MHLAVSNQANRPLELSFNRVDNLAVPYGFFFDATLLIKESFLTDESWFVFHEQEKGTKHFWVTESKTEVAFNQRIAVKAPRVQVHIKMRR